MDNFRCIAVLGRGHFGKVSQLFCGVMRALFLEHWNIVHYTVKLRHNGRG